MSNNINKLYNHQEMEINRLLVRLKMIECKVKNKSSYEIIIKSLNSNRDIFQIQLFVNILIGSASKTMEIKIYMIKPMGSSMETI